MGAARIAAPENATISSRTGHSLAADSEDLAHRNEQIDTVALSTESNDNAIFAAIGYPRVARMAIWPRRKSSFHGAINRMPMHPTTAPAISVALPIKNGLPYLKATMNGLCRQTYQNFKLVIQDSLSTDGSLEYLRSVDSFFSIDIVSEADPSLTAGYNRAFQRCTGDLVVAIACDEVLDDDALEKYISWYRAHPDAIFIFGGSRLVNEKDEIIQTFQPLDFDLLDYVRLRMCPTTAGAFNRRVLGAELRMDERLNSVPDFELLTRIALRFGPQRIICKHAITMTARADASSMSFRPSSFRQFAKDKATVIDRLLAGPLRDDFARYLRRDFLFNLHASQAEQLYFMWGDTPEFREEALAANAQMSGQDRVKRLAHSSRHLRWKEDTRSVEIRQNIPPLVPPADMAIILFRARPNMTRAEPNWVANGARVSVRRDSVVIRTPAKPWNYAAVTELDLTQTRFEDAWHWVRVRFSDVTGNPMLSLFDQAQNVIEAERQLPRGTKPQDICIVLDHDGCGKVLVRNGGSAVASSVKILRIEVLTMPIMHSDEVSRVLRDGPARPLPARRLMNARFGYGRSWLRWLAGRHSSARSMP